MSVKFSRWVWGQKLGPTEKLVLLCLADHADDDGASYPSLTLISEETGLCRRAVIGANHKLELAGYIIRIRGCTGKNTDYRIMIDRAPDALGHYMHQGTRCPSGRAPHALSRAPDALVVGHHMPPNHHINHHEPSYQPSLLSDSVENRPDGEKNDQPQTPIHAKPESKKPEHAQLELLQEIPEAKKSDKDFEDFYEAYPRKVGKPNARKAFSKAIKRASLKEIADGLELAKKGWDDPQFIPHPATWLNRDGWNDKPILKTNQPNQQNEPMKGSLHAKLTADREFQARSIAVARARARGLPDDYFLEPQRADSGRFEPGDGGICIDGNARDVTGQYGG